MLLVNFGMMLQVVGNVLVQQILPLRLFIPIAQVHILVAIIASRRLRGCCSASPLVRGALAIPASPCCLIIVTILASDTGLRCVPEDGRQAVKHTQSHGGCNGSCCGWLEAKYRQQ